MNSRFTLKKELGQGSFSTIVSAYDHLINEKVALKIEKIDKSKKILQFEYKVLKYIQGLPHICSVYDFIESKDSQFQNFIVMQKQGLI